MIPSDDVGDDSDIGGAVETRAQKQKRNENLKPLKTANVPMDDVTPEQLRQAQKEDSTLKNCFKHVGNPRPLKGKEGISEFILRNDILYRKVSGNDKPSDQLVVPEKFRNQVMKLAHDSIMAGHLGIAKTTDKVQSQFYWPGVGSDVMRYCKSCDICQRTCDKGRVTKVPLGHMPLIDTPFKRVAVDIVGPISPTSKHGNRYILTLVDYATRFPEAVPLRNIDTERVAEALVDIFSRVGVPSEILTDRGSQFTSDVMKEVSRLLSLRQLTTTPYHPICNGLVEKFNGTLKRMLKRMCEERPSDWDRYIGPLLFAYREAPQASTGFAPFELLYGRTVRGPMAILKEMWTSEVDNPETRSTYQYVLDLRERLEETCALARSELQESSRGTRSTITGRLKVASSNQTNQSESASDVVVNDELGVGQSHEVKRVLSKFTDVLTDVPGKTDVLKCDIKLTTDKPIKAKPYPVPLSMRDSLQEEVRKMIDMGVIEPSNSPYSSPVVLVPKPDGTKRFCVDYRKLNKVTTYEAEPMQTMTEIFSELSNDKYFSRIDLTKGYWQVEMTQSAKEKTAFVTPDGLWQFKTMPFGLVGAPAVFTRLMRTILRDVPNVVNYLDDILIHTETWDEHVECLELLFQTLRESGLTARPIAPLSDLTRKGSPNRVIWGSAQDKAFNDLKQALISPPLLRLPDVNKQFVLRTDASDVGIGAVLLQEHEGELFPVAYASRKLLERERNYSVIERECLGLVWAVQKFHVYLYGSVTSAEFFGVHPGGSHPWDTNVESNWTSGERFLLLTKSRDTSYEGESRHRCGDARRLLPDCSVYELSVNALTSAIYFDSLCAVKSQFHDAKSNDSNKDQTVLASVPDLECGYSRQLFIQWCHNPKNSVVLTSRTSPGTLARTLIDQEDYKSFKLRVSKRVKLEGKELDEYRVTEKEKEKERKAAEAKRRLESESSESSEDEMEVDEAGRLKPQHDIMVGAELNKKGTNFFKHAKKTYAMYPFHEKRIQWDEYGEIINPEDFKMVETNIAEEDAGKQEEQADDADDIGEEEVDVPTKCTASEVAIDLKCSLTYIDFEGRSDGESIKKLVLQVKPRQLVIVRGSPAATQTLAEYYRLQLSGSKVFTPGVNEVIDATLESHIYQVKLKDSLVSSLDFQKAKDIELTWIDGQLDLETGGRSLMLEEEDETEMETTAPGLEMKKKKADDRIATLDAVSVSEETGHSQVFVNAPRFQDVKQVMTRNGILAEFTGGVLVCNSTVAVRRHESGRLCLEGTLCDDYFKVRDLLYEQYAVI
ncbi:hypothetical protein BSL78_10987 [Apostichopus japonicus]|uniref:Uncharacterized protein n=1 Tax=Stichopus japonicus TaxID=307972 RepID=A0A2G8KW56_STIJA|nr:hypothetical protein BSL78_10987 [Apostichopus japonicus]